MDTTLVVSIPCIIVYTMQQEHLFFLFQQSVNAVPQGGSVAAETDFLTCFPVFALDLVVTADSQMLARFFGKPYAKLVQS